MKYLRYLTQEQDRWDSLALRFYGSCYEYERIIAANKTVPITPVLPRGRILAIPIIERDTTQPLVGLPPWKVQDV